MSYLKGSQIESLDLLLDRAREGDEEALGTLLSKLRAQTHAMACSLIWNRGGNIADAEDLAQGALLQLSRHVGKIQDVAHLGRTVRLILQRLSIDDVRKFARQVPTVSIGPWMEELENIGRLDAVSCPPDLSIFSNSNAENSDVEALEAVERLAPGFRQRVEASPRNLRICDLLAQGNSETEAIERVASEFQTTLGSIRAGFCRFKREFRPKD